MSTRVKSSDQGVFCAKRESIGHHISHIIGNIVWVG
jgi:hypothetical protein